MITSLFLTFVCSILLWIFSFLPHVTTMPAWYNPVSESFQMFSALQSLPFIGTVIVIAVLMLTMIAGWQVVVFSNWLYNKIRGSG